MIFGGNNYIAPGLRLRDVRGRLADGINPATLGTLTESHGTFRNGRIIVAATDAGGKVGTTPIDRVRYSVSTDGGYTFNSYEAPTTFPGTMSLAGDPATGIDSHGRMWVLWHELNGGLGCPKFNIPFTDSTILLGYSDGRALTLVSGPPGLWTTHDEAHNIYLDHPSMAITSDDSQHFVWGTRGFADGHFAYEYAKRLPSGTFTHADMKPRANGVGPFIEAASDDALYVWWGDYTERLPDLSYIYGAVEVCPLVDGVCVAPVSATGTVCSASDIVINGTDLRGGNYNFACARDAAEHLLVVFIIADTGVGGTCLQHHRDPRWGFVESYDRGLHWSPPVYPAVGSGSPQFQPAVSSTEDGTIIVTYNEVVVGAVSRRIAIRRPGADWILGTMPTVSGQAFNPLQLPHKCNENAETRFLGDYNFVRGSLSHSYVLGFDTRTPQSPGSSGLSLYLSAVSGASWD